MKRLLLLLALLLLVTGVFCACNQVPAGDASNDGTSDDGEANGGTTDGGTSDGGTSDGGTSDGGEADGGEAVEGTLNGSAYTRIDASGNADSDGEYILFGEYPQSLKAAGVTVGTEADARGYFLGSDGFYYAKAVAATYEEGYVFSTGAEITSNTTYYFKVEPIRWRILSKKDGNALILCDSIIANKAFDEYTLDSLHNNNYEKSDIRAWLNGAFYETAFDELQKTLVNTVKIDNSAASTTSNTWQDNPRACKDTEDKVFLLSYADAVNPAYGFAPNTNADASRAMTVSDYSRAMGAKIDNDPQSEFFGTGVWWLRSPYFGNDYMVKEVYYNGYIGIGSVITWRTTCVVPALEIALR